MTKLKSRYRDGGTTRRPEPSGDGRDQDREGGAAALDQSVERGERGGRESRLRLRPLRDVVRQQHRAQGQPEDASRRRRRSGHEGHGVRQVHPTVGGRVGRLETRSGQEEGGTSGQEAEKGGNGNGIESVEEMQR